MIPKIFYCPACKKQNTKSQQVYIMSIAHTSKSLMIGLNDFPEFTDCTHCGKKIDTQNIINGLHDLDPLTNQYQWLYFLGLFGMPVLFKMVLGWPLIVAVFVGALAGILSAYIIVAGIKSATPKR